MKGFHTDIGQATLNNSNFRQVLYTGQHTQLVLMTLKVGEEIGLETHPQNDQFFRFEKGTAKVTIDGNEYLVKDGDVTIVPAGAEHNVINTSPTEELKLYTLYSPPHHRDKVLHQIKSQAETDSEEFDGKTSE